MGTWKNWTKIGQKLSKWAGRPHFSGRKARTTYAAKTVFYLKPVNWVTVFGVVLDLQVLDAGFTSPL
jgi:hypothetical protein